MISRSGLLLPTAGLAAYSGKKARHASAQLLNIRNAMKHLNHTLKHTNEGRSQDLKTAASRLRMVNDAISILVSALTYQVTARTLNQSCCDYCGKQYVAPGPIAWTSHHCEVLIAAENIISESVQRLLAERAIAKNEIERNRVVLFRQPT